MKYIYKEHDHNTITFDKHMFLPKGTNLLNNQDDFPLQNAWYQFPQTIVNPEGVKMEFKTKGMILNHSL